MPVHVIGEAGLSFGESINLAAFLITFAFAILPKGWRPGLIWLAFIIVSNSVALIILPEWDERRAYVPYNTIIHIGLFLIVRTIRGFSKRDTAQPSPPAQGVAQLPVSAHPLAGMRFDDPYELLVRESEFAPAAIRQGQAVVAIVEADVSDGAHFGLGDPKEQQLRIRLATPGLDIVVHSFPLDPSARLKAGDLVTWMPAIYSEVTGSWIGPIVAELVPAYGNDGVVTRRSFVS
jgi:hypothetical protein